jgi:hypothetical protein
MAAQHSDRGRDHVRATCRRFFTRMATTPPPCHDPSFPSPGLPFSSVWSLPAETRHGHNLWDHGRDILAGHPPGTRFVFRPDGRVPAGAVCH